MEKIKLQQKYIISDLIEMLVKDYWSINDSGSKHFCRDIGLSDLYIYSCKYEEAIHENLVCYVEEPPEVTEEDNEIFPDFVINKGLSFLYSGDDFQTVIEVVFDQKRTPTLEDFINSLNHYRIYDAFLEL